MPKQYLDIHEPRSLWGVPSYRYQPERATAVSKHGLSRDLEPYRLAA